MPRELWYYIYIYVMQVSALILCSGCRENGTTESQTHTHDGYRMHLPRGFTHKGIKIYVDIINHY